MPKTLTGKTQIIAPKSTPTANDFSSVITIAPDEEEALSKRGHLYAIFNIRDTTTYETELTSKLIKDILGRAYYHSENASPIQALEEAMAAVKKDILHLQENDDTTKAELSMVASVLWAGVLYTVKMGEGEISIVRGGNLKEVDLIKEGAFSVATGMVKPEDVVILSTSSFARKFPPKKLFKLDPQEKDLLEQNEACLMIKFETPKDKETISQEEDFGKKQPKPNALKKIPDIIRKIRRKKQQSTEGVKAINTKRTIKINKKAISTGITVALGVTLLAALLLTQRNRARAPLEPSPEGDVQIADPNTEEEVPTFDANNIPSEVFYDLRITNPNASPIKVSILGENIYVLDKTGTLYVSDVSTPRFQEVPNTRFDGANLMKAKGDELFLNGTGIIKNYDPEEETTGETPVSSSGVFCPYLSSLYQVEDNAILKYTIGEESEGAVWAENAEFNNAKDLAIAVSIYVLTKENTIVRYTSGVKDTNFQISGLEKPFLNAVSLDTNWDWKNLYITDAGNNRIVIVTKAGAFVGELEGENTPWEDLKSISITPDESTLFVLAGTRIYEVTL